MNRTEFNTMLDTVCRDIAEKAGNMDGFDPQRTEADTRFIAAVALMVTDRYYSELTKLMAERAEKDPLRED